MQLTFEVHTEISAFRAEKKSKSFILKIAENRRSSGKYHVQLSEDGFKTYKLQEASEKNRNVAAGSALKLHFVRYAQRNSIVATATPIAITNRETY